MLCRLLCMNVWLWLWLWLWQQQQLVRQCGKDIIKSIKLIIIGIIRESPNASLLQMALTLMQSLP